MTETNFWRKVLSSDETIEKEFGLGKKFIKYSLIFWLIIGVVSLLGGLGGFGLLVILIALFYYLFYIKRAYRYAFTNKRVLAKRGWLSTILISIEYEKITDILVKQNFLDKSFDVGVLAINTAGTGGHELVLKNIGEPYRVKQELYEIMEQSKGVYKDRKQSGQNNGEIGDLEKLAKWKEKGIITQEEFEVKKKRILGL